MPEERAALLRRIQELEDRLEEAEETLRAIRGGEVDAVVVSGPGGDSVYTLKGADEPYRILVQEMSEGALTLTPEGLILFSNEQFSELIGRPSEQVIGSKIQEFIVAGDAAHVSALLAGRSAARAEVQLKKADGTSTPAYLSADRLQLDSADCICLVVTDLTLQKRNEEIVAAEKLARSILEQAASAILVVDPDGQIIRASRVAEELAGAPVLLRKFDAVFPLQADPKGRSQTFARIVSRLRRGGTISRLEATAHMPDGRLLQLVVKAAQLLTAGSQVLGYIISLSDITELKAAMAALRQREEERAQEARMKDEFLGLLGHELRNPLATVSTAMSLLATGVTPERRASLEEMMGRQVAVLRRLVDDLLDLARITHGHIELRKERIELSQFLQKAASAARSPIAGRRQELIVRLPSERVVFMADGVRMEQIATNLLNNASKYTAGGGTIELSGDRETADVVIRCKDNGRGIPSEMQKIIFEPFARLHAAGESAEAGVGIGLALVKRLAELHGGSVSVASGGPGTGSEFVVRLPIVEPPTATPAAGEPALARGARKPLSVVVVEDNPDAAQSLAIALEQAGHRAILFPDGPSALSGLARLKPDAVLLDIGLPGMDGYELAARLRKRRNLKPALFVALSGFKPRAETGKVRSDFDHYFLKPVDQGKLLRLIETHARGR